MNKRRNVREEALPQVKTLADAKRLIIAELNRWNGQVGVDEDWIILFFGEMSPFLLFAASLGCICIRTLPGQVTENASWHLTR